MDSPILSAFSGKSYYPRNGSTLQNISVCPVCCVIKICRGDIMSQGRLVSLSLLCRPKCTLSSLSFSLSLSFFSLSLSLSLSSLLSLSLSLSLTLHSLSLSLSLSYTHPNALSPYACLNAPLLSLLSRMHAQMPLSRMHAQMRSQVPKFGTE